MTSIPSQTGANALIFWYGHDGNVHHEPQSSHYTEDTQHFDAESINRDQSDSVFRGNPKWPSAYVELFESMYICTHTTLP